MNWCWYDWDSLSKKSISSSMSERRTRVRSELIHLCSTALTVRNTKFQTPTLSRHFSNICTPPRGSKSSKSMAYLNRPWQIISLTKSSGYIHTENDSMLVKIVKIKILWKQFLNKLHFNKLGTISQNSCWGCFRWGQQVSESPVLLIYNLKMQDYFFFTLNLVFILPKYANSAIKMFGFFTR